MKNKKKKKNKKFGFTLVELLAVIVILAIILVIAVPKITDTINQSKKSSLESSTKLVAESLETDYQSSLAAGTTFATSGSCASYVDSNEYSSCTYEIKNDKANVKLTGASTGKFANMKSFGTKTNASALETKSITINKTLEQGTEYDDGTYIYRYKQKKSGSSWTNMDDDGWGITLKDKTATEVNVDPYSYINGKPIVSTKSMFFAASNLTKVKLDNFDTSNVVNMEYMFYGCESLLNLDLSHFDTSNVESMWAMFRNCNMLTSLDISNFDTSNVEYMRELFCRCESLLNLDVSNFDTSKVIDMTEMFYQCKLLYLDVSHFDTSSVTDMEYMFSGSALLTDLDLSNWDTSSVTNMEGMFSDCPALRTLNLTNIFNMNAVTNTTEMFANTDLVISVSNTTLQTKLNSLSTADKPPTVTVQLV